MNITATAISLNVAEPQASAEFLTRHVGHTVAMQADGFVSLNHPDGGPNVIYLRTGLPTFKPAHRAGSAGDGLLLVFVVDDVDTAYEAVRAAGGAVDHPGQEVGGVSASANSKIPTGSSSSSFNGCNRGMLEGRAPGEAREFCRAPVHGCGRGSLRQPRQHDCGRRPAHGRIWRRRWRRCRIR